VEILNPSEGYFVVCRGETPDVGFAREPQPVHCWRCGEDERCMEKALACLILKLEHRRVAFSMEVL